MNILTNILASFSNPYMIMALFVAVSMIICMIYVHVSEKKDMKFKKEHMYFDEVTAKWYFNPSSNKI